MDTLKIRTFTPQEWKIYKDLRLRALTDSPDAFGRTLAEERERPDIEWSSRLTSGANSSLDLPLLAEVAREPVGLAWGRIEKSDPDVANLYQMWVAPSYRRLGIGQMLLETVIAWARSKDVNCVELGVSSDNKPAVRLYQRAGFDPIGEPQAFRQGSELSVQRMRLNLRTGRA